MANRVSVFVDGGSLYHAQRNILNWWIEPRFLLDWIEDNRGDIVDACHYNCIGPQDSDGQMGFLTALTHIGYRLFTKPLKVFRREDGGERWKGSVIADIIMDMFNTIDQYDEAVIVTGDSDFARVIQMLRARGKKYFIMGVQPMIAGELRAEASGYIGDFAELRQYLEKEKQPALSR